MASCELCEEKGIHGHWALRRSIEATFQHELFQARQEYARLCALFKDVSWYHFELLAVDWTNPWHQTVPDTLIRLHGMRTALLDHARYKTTFPLFYEGPVGCAPPCPPSLVLSEIKDAWELVQFWELRVSDMHTFAPGGVDYDKILRRTSLPTQHNKRKRISNTHCNGGNKSHRPNVCTQLDWEITQADETDQALLG